MVAVAPSLGQEFPVRGRCCPLLFRDEWLEPAPPGAELAPRYALPPVYVRVRKRQDIADTLDRFGARDGLRFQPEMAKLCGQRLRVVAQIRQVFEFDRWTPPVRPVYLLEGARCQGAALGADGPCDRRCALLWHQDWLEWD